jgi:hypothetical protein
MRTARQIAHLSGNGNSYGTRNYSGVAVSLRVRLRRFGRRPVTSALPPTNEPASQERAAREAGGGDGVTR